MLALRIGSMSHFSNPTVNEQDNDGNDEDDQDDDGGKDD
jgi:hypothetical protein